MRVTRISVGKDFVALLRQRAKSGGAVTVHRALHLADTEVVLNENAFVAAAATLNAVDFASRTSDVGGLLADSAIVSSTRAPDDIRLFVAANVTATAANSRINVVPI